MTLTRYGGYGGPELHQFQSPYAVFHVYVYSKNRTGRNQLDSTSTLNRLVCISTSRKIRLCALMHQLHVQLLWRGVSRLWGRFHVPWEYFLTIKFLVHESNNHSIPVKLSVMSDDVYPNMGITKQVRLATR